MEVKEIKEGKTKLLVPDFTGIPEHGPAFYNPKMSVNRSRSSFIIRALFDKARIADILTGIGARAVRYANEGNDFEVYANDIQPSAIKLCEKNAELNDVKVETSIMEANQFLIQNKYDKFDFIDIDPFGSPANFLNSAMQAIKPTGGVLGITATDTGTLAGIYPKACFRKYYTVSERTSFAHELGIRNLIASVFREAAKYEYSIEPLYSYNHIHYNRTFIKIQGGRKTTNRDLKNIGYAKYCKKCERRELIPAFDDYELKCECGEQAKVLGLTWIGKIAKPDFLDLLYKKRTDGMKMHEPEAAYIEKGNSEYEIEMPYYNISSLTKIHKKESQKLSKIIEELKSNGYKAHSTHFEGQAIKTNAPYSQLINAVFKK